MNFRQPEWARTWSTATVLNIARLGPVGGRLRAPGTWGSLAGVLFFWLFFRDEGEVVNVIGVACAAYFAVGVCCLLYTSPSPRDGATSRMPSSA